MPEIQIRPAVSEDIPGLLTLEHNYVSDTVWQMEIQRGAEGGMDENQVSISFRQMRLPRSVRVEYPRPASRLSQDWGERDGLLVAELVDPTAGADEHQRLVGYASLQLGVAPLTAWVTDLAVRRRMRRQGIGTALLLAAQEWGAVHLCRRLVLEMQPKNYPAIELARKLGFDLCGYNDRYFENHDIALFFARSIVWSGKR
jgi:ribosomal protein S18 acetylase RimI-like enzyme